MSDAWYGKVVKEDYHVTMWVVEEWLPGCREAGYKKAEAETTSLDLQLPKFKE